MHLMSPKILWLSPPPEKKNRKVSIAKLALKQTCYSAGLPLVREKSGNSRSGKSQGIMKKVREMYNFQESHKKLPLVRVI